MQVTKKVPLKSSTLPILARLAREWFQIDTDMPPYQH